MNLSEKIERLQSIVDSMGAVAVAFSAGIDSTLVLRICHDRLRPRVLAVIGVSASLPPGELEEARELAAVIGAPLLEVATDELANQDYTSNPTNRCYFCKTELYKVVVPYARARGIPIVVDGFNVDDQGDFRPGARATDEAGVRHPLFEAGFTKEDIRAYAKQLGLPNWNKPALACLSSRVPHGTSIDESLLARIGRAELCLHELGMQRCRVRAHGEIARIEVEEGQLQTVISRRSEILAALRPSGFRFVTLDLQGYRSGSLNPVLSET